MACGTTDCSTFLFLADCCLDAVVAAKRLVSSQRGSLLDRHPWADNLHFFAQQPRLTC